MKTIGGLFNMNFPCPLCGRPHAIRLCTTFLALDTSKKRDFVMNNRLCINCLASSHERSACRSLDVCKLCNGFHHSFLHRMTDEYIWFPMTAMVRIYTCYGRRDQNTRVLLDPNSKYSYIALEEALDMYCLMDNERTTVVLQHQSVDRKKIKVELVVRDRVFGVTPTARIDKEANMFANPPGNVIDADRYWNRSSPYFVILAAEACRAVFVGPPMVQPGRIFIQDSIFGRLYFGEGKKVPITSRLN